MEDQVLSLMRRVSIGEKQPLKEIDRNRIPSGEGEGDQPSKNDQVQFNKLITKAKELSSQGQIQKALGLYKDAYEINKSEKLARRIGKMEAYLKEYGDGSEEGEEEDSNMVHVGEGFYLYKDLFNKLYPHQKQGVLWFWKLNRKRKGGILGDDMGLGKTIQVISFLSGMFDAQKISSVLIVMPVSLIMNWEQELDKWAPGIRTTSYHGSSKRERERALAKVQRRGGVCLTSYGMVVSSWEQLSQREGREFVWDYVILDEGHKIKNPTKTSKGVRAIAAKNRIILSGTPIQNNLKELWALFDYVHQGSLLGTARTFKMEFEGPITRARERDATSGEKRLGSEMAETLKKIIAPYFLRRTKADVKAETKKIKSQQPEEGVERGPVMPNLTRKNDLVIWTYLSETQQKIYEDFISLEEVKELLMTSKSPLTALIVLKKICDHPRLLSNMACAQLGLDGDSQDLDLDSEEKSKECAATRIHHIADEVLITEAGKMVFLVELVDNLKATGHRCLIFSQSRKMLDIIQKVVTNRGHKIMRLDGTVTHLYEREQIINKFQTDPSYSIFLLTTQVGGVGLTLTSADRVIIYDPSWNPATDAQAVDRVFRIGQSKNVVIYRLITCGTIEEKIYRRQVFKDSLTRQTTGNSKNPYRYFSKQELRELFTLDDPRYSNTQQQLQSMHSAHRKTDTGLDEHVAFLHTLDMFGISDHDLMFSQEAEHESDDETSNDYVQKRVQEAAEKITMESEINDQLVQQISKHPPAYEAGSVKQRLQEQMNVIQMPSKQPANEMSIREKLKQMNLVKPEKPKEPVWSCSACTFNNPGMLTVCKMCNTPRGGLPMEAKIEENKEEKDDDDDDEHASPYFNTGPTIQRSKSPEEVIDLADVGEENIEADEDLNQTVADLTMEDIDEIPDSEEEYSGKQSTPPRPNVPPAVFEEQMIISPDASRPIVQTIPRKNSMEDKHIMQFNQQFVSAINEESRRQGNTFAMDDRDLITPDLEPQHLLVEESPEGGKSNSTTPYKDSVIVIDSAQNTPSIAGRTPSPVGGSVIEDSVNESDVIDISENEDDEMVVADSLSESKGAIKNTGSRPGSATSAMLSASGDKRLSSQNGYQSATSATPDSGMQKSMNHSSSFRSSRQQSPGINDHIPLPKGISRNSAGKPTMGKTSSITPQSATRGHHVADNNEQDSPLHTVKRKSHQKITRIESDESEAEEDDEEFHSADEEPEDAEDVEKSEEEEEEEDNEGDSMDNFIVDDDDDDGVDEEGSKEDEEESEAEDEDETGLTPEEQLAFDRYKAKGIKYYREKEYQKAMVYALKALDLQQDNDMQMMALKIKQKMEK